MKRIERNEEEQEMGEAWLLPYSDLMTLLLAVFIVLFAISNIDEAKAKAVANAFTSIFMGGETIIDDAPTPSSVENDPVVIAEPPPATPDTSQVESGQSLVMMEDKKKLEDAFKEYFEENNMTEGVGISSTEDVLTITLPSDMLFPSGHAELDAKEIALAKDLSGLLYNARETGFIFQVLVSGHTDNVPVDNTRYSSNFRLSLDRAANFMAAMVEDMPIDSRLFSAVGHGDLDPVAPNDTPEGRAQNRRVELHIDCSQGMDDQLPVE